MKRPTASAWRVFCLTSVLVVCLSLAFTTTTPAQESTKLGFDFEIQSVAAPLLDEFSFINKTFKKIGTITACVACEEGICCRENCPKTEVAVAKKISCEQSSACSAESPCCQQSVAWREQPVARQETVVFQPCTPQEASGKPLDGFTKRELLELLVDTLTSSAAAQAALEVREESIEERDELFQAIVELTTENAKLEAQAELARQQVKMHAQVTELLVEKARLEAELDLARAKQELAEKYAAVAVKSQRIIPTLVGQQQHKCTNSCSDCPSSRKAESTASEPIDTNTIR